MEQPILDLLMSRLARIEQQNDDQLALIRQHIEKDEAVHRVVSTHQTYFKLAGSVLTLLSGSVGYMLNKLGLK